MNKANFIKSIELITVHAVPFIFIDQWNSGIFIAKPTIHRHVHEFSKRNLKIRWTVAKLELWRFSS